MFIIVLSHEERLYSFELSNNVFEKLKWRCVEKVGGRTARDVFSNAIAITKLKCEQKNMFQFFKKISGQVLMPSVVFFISEGHCSQLFLRATIWYKICLKIFEHQIRFSLKLPRLDILSHR